MNNSAALASTIVAVALAFAVALPARASCRDDIQELGARLAASPAKNANVVAAKKELAKAEKAVKFDEIGCHNAIVRAWRAYKAPAPQKEANGAAQR